MTLPPLSRRVIACAIDVRRELGYGFLERVYENAMVVELARGGFAVEQQVPLQVRFRGAIVGDYVADLVVERKLLIEVKAIDRVAQIHTAQVLNYLRATGYSVGLLLNFGPAKLGVDRVVNGYDDEEDPI
jgi:GxxExxY protein